MPKRDTKHLLQRNGWWHLNARLPETNRHWRKTLKTKSLQVAQQKRDELLRKIYELSVQVDEAKTVLELRKEYLSTASEEGREVLEEIYLDKADDLAVELGVYELYHLPDQATKDEKFWTEEEKKPKHFYATATGKLHPFALIKEPWLAEITNPKTRSDYRRAIEVLMESFTTVEGVNWQKANLFLRNVGKEKGVNQATVRKWQSAYINLWKWCDQDPSAWRKHEIPKTGKTLVVYPFTPEEVVKMYQTLNQRNDVTASWLKHTVWIAAHSGRRQGAIAKLTYYPENETIRFPKGKHESKDAIVPAHPAIRQNLLDWTENRKTAETISKRFTEFKKELGFGPAKRFHSFRHTFSTEMRNLGVPEVITAGIVSHKINTMTYGLYSGDLPMPLMREHLVKLDYGYQP